MADQIQEIKCRFEEIENQRIALRLLEQDGPRRSSSEQRAQTSHLVDESGIFGREKEKEKLISLLSSQCNDGKVVSVVTIVGIGGLGKTTLAQLACKDLKARRVFDKFGWVCVSEDFNVERLTRDTIESITQRTCTFTNLSALQEEVIKVIKGKMVLLILDDVWNENRNRWETFKIPFKSAASVKILVTTRSKLVAEIMQTEQTFNLGNLSEEQCWSLFEHYAFDGGADKRVGSDFKEIGKHITKKCGMLPLAVKSIASLLRYEMDEESWREILESELWETDATNAIFSPLQLSYARLQTYLKPCLIFCSMFPKDYVHDLRKLVKLWISQGYIESKGNKCAEKIGFEYGKQLWERSFLEGSRIPWEILAVEGPNSAAPWEYFKLHDLIHDLARVNSKNGCFSIGDGLSTSKLPDFSYELYNLYIDNFEEKIEPIPLESFRTLRTLIIMGHRIENFIRTADLSLPQRLRALEIFVHENPILGFNCLNHELKCVSFCGNLKHLHYLSLCKFPFQRLPECICSLYNLQYLKIMNCSFNEFPKGTGNLISLETLEKLSCALLEWLPESLCELKALRNLKIESCKQFQMLPSGMGNLVSLETLEISSCALLEWLPESFCQLTTLRELVLQDISLKELPNGMGNLTNLQLLHIECQGTLAPTVVVGTQSLCMRLACEKIGWLRDFHNVCRTLCLISLENVSNLTDIQCANLVSMHNSESLELYWDHAVSLETEILLDHERPRNISRRLL